MQNQRQVLAAWHGTLGSHALQLAAERLERLDDRVAQRELRRRAAREVAGAAPRPWQVEAALQMWILVPATQWVGAGAGDFCGDPILKMWGMLGIRLPWETPLDCGY